MVISPENILLVGAILLFLSVLVRKNRSEIWCTGVAIVPRCWNACRFRRFRYLFR